MPRIKGPLETVFEPVMESRAMRELDRVLHAVARKDVVLSLVGESGTGKEIFARRIHELSARRTAAFIPIHCAAIPEAVFETELFGRERGAGRAPSELARGKLEEAAGGTLFFDEIGEMPLGVQAKLLRFLEDRKFTRVGGTTKIGVDARIVCATSRPLDGDVKAGRFRADLLYAIQGFPIRVPPLRERPLDIGPLVRLFVDGMVAKHGTARPKFLRDAMAALRAYSWPGNARELRNVVELVCLLREGKSVRVRDLPEAIQRAASKAKPRSELLGETLEISLDRPLDETIEAILQAALELENGNRSRAARRLGVSLRTMQRFADRTVTERTETRH